LCVVVVVGDGAGGGADDLYGGEFCKFVQICLW
jgi:hypothetical protein